MKSGVIFILVFLLIAFVIGCDDTNTQQAASNAIRIGAVYPLSGQQALVGQEIKNGIDLAVDIINNSYPGMNIPLAEGTGLPALAGSPILVVYADHQSTQVGARQRTEELITNSKVVALIGAYQSEETRAASEVAEQAGIPFLNPDSTSPALTQRNFQWFFRTTPTDATFTIDAFEFMTELNSTRNAGIRNLAVVHENTDFGLSFISLVNEYAPQYGMQVVTAIETQGASQNVSADVTQLRATQADAVLFAVYTEDAIRFMQEFKRQNYAPSLVWADDAGFISQEYEQTLGADADYVTSREVWSLDVTRTNPLAAQVNALYRARYGTDMNGNSVRAFIGIMTLAEAINRAVSTDPSRIRNALRATNIPADQLIAPWRGIHFDATGQNTLGDGIIVQMLDNRYTTIWPQAIAVLQPVFPFPSWNAR